MHFHPCHPSRSTIYKMQDTQDNELRCASDPGKKLLYHLFVLEKSYHTTILFNVMRYFA